MSILYSSDKAKRIQYLKQLIEAKEASLRKAPEGALKIQKESDKYYYHFYAPNGCKNTYSHYLRINDKRDMALARAIAQRGYDEKILKCAAEELKMLQNEQDFYAKGCVDNLYSTLNPGRQALITPIRMTDEAYVAKWLTRSYQKKGFMEGSPVFETKRGDRVRSKSEMGIANDLFDEEIPYLYEVPIRLVDCITGQSYTAHPDFMVLNVKERKEFLWEHFGKMDDPEYAQRNIKKLVEYENAGYYPGENMIVTFETRTFPLTPKEIKRVISHYLK